jgi:ATP-binding cassette subfamily F protein 3
LKEVQPEPVAPTNGHQSPAEAASSKGKRLNPIKRKQIEERVRELEGKINRAETAIAEFETALQNYVSAEETQRQSRELEEQKTAHASFIGEWEELSQSLQDD